MTSTGRALTIGALAKGAGVTTPTIRYYEEIGLLPRAGRTRSGQRTYDHSDMARVVFIRRCRDLGFSIDRVRLLAGLSVSGDKDCTEVRDIARHNLEEVREKLAEFHALEISLRDFVTSCDTGCAGKVGRDCVIFESIAAPLAGSESSGSRGV